MTRKRNHRMQRRALTHPVLAAVVRRNLAAELQRLQTDAGLQAHLGDNYAALANSAGRLGYITAYACGQIQLDTPDVRILRGTCEALGDMVANPGCLEHQRPAIQSGLAAISRLLPQLPDRALAAGALELERLLALPEGMGTEDVRAALEGDAT